MKIVTYTTTEAVPDHKRCLAQYAEVHKNFIFSFYGATPEEAQSKAQDFWNTEILPKLKSPKEPAAKAPAPLKAADDMFGDLF